MPNDIWGDTAGIKKMAPCVNKSKIICFVNNPLILSTNLTNKYNSYTKRTQINLLAIEHNDFFAKFVMNKVSVKLSEMKQPAMHACMV